MGFHRLPVDDTRLVFELVGCVDCATLEQGIAEVRRPAAIRCCISSSRLSVMAVPSVTELAYRATIAWVMAVTSLWFRPAGPLNLYA